MVKVDTSSMKIRLESITEATKDNFQSVTTQVAGNLLNESKRTSPKDTGENAQKHRMDVKREGTKIIGTVEAYSQHAVYLHEGTGLYAKNGMGRKSPWGYTVESSRSKYKGFHWTRGIKPNPWLDEVMENNLKKIKRLYRNVVKG